MVWLVCCLLCTKKIPRYPPYDPLDVGYNLLRTFTFNYGLHHHKSNGKINELNGSSWPKNCEWKPGRGCLPVEYPALAASWYPMKNHHVQPKRSRGYSVAMRSWRISVSGTSDGLSRLLWSMVPWSLHQTWRNVEPTSGGFFHELTESKIWWIPNRNFKLIKKIYLATDRTDWGRWDSTGDSTWFYYLTIEQKGMENGPWIDDLPIKNDDFPPVVNRPLLTHWGLP